MSRANTCDSRRLAVFLRGELPQSEEAQVTRHLDTCSRCQREIETFAGEDRWWQEARDLLTPEPFPAFGPAVNSPWERSSRPAGVPSSGHADGDHEPSPIDADSHWGLAPGFLDRTDDPASLGRIGGYEIVGIVGRGGTGVVLKAFDRTLNRYAAIKVLATHLGWSGAARRRFAREAQAAAAVAHEHIVPIHAVAEHRGIPYMSMRYVAGQSLQQRIEKRGPLEVREILRIGRQVAAGLSAAHAQGLVHRDVKPANILLENGVERVLLTDFGLARAVDDASLTCSGVIAGTPEYMAPEQARGEAIDHRADLFSLGTVLYAMCTGRSPFRAETTMGVLHRVCNDTPRPIREINPDIPAWLVEIVRKCHERRPAKRFRTADEVAELLERRLAESQGPVRRTVLRRWLAEGRDRLRFRISAGSRRATVRKAFALTVVGCLVLALGWGWATGRLGIWGGGAEIDGGGSSTSSADYSMPPPDRFDDEMRTLREEVERQESLAKSMGPSSPDWFAEAARVRDELTNLERELP